MILWRRTISVGLGLVAASSLCTVAQAAPSQAEMIDAPRLIQVDEVSLDQAQIGEVLIDQAQIDEATDTLVTPELFTEAVPVSPEDLSDAAVEALAAEVTPVPTQVLENLSQGQIEAIATIISTTDESASAGTMANLPIEVLTQLDTLPGIEQPVGRRRWLPRSLVRRLRLPQAIASLVRQPKNTALVMLGNHIVVVNPVTGAVLGAVLSAL
ncbi:hypothetical protein IQ273_10255 [Nodosilinea sp. LEGE 07298]|uniref:hypothetical protein n=1 Tax=Nodosilinea sp. LEGE 07298 TaxID=2777970 RepID=UPI0018823934|nr:hypothetical protein [Nodosilinea sp. LEGE 07298]MBE9109792.1 hypothetical protein [Nodosilinea sp. LEGE 07298]